MRATYDNVERESLKTKSKRSVRTVPMPKILRAYLAAHRLRTVGDDGYVFCQPGSPAVPFRPTPVDKRAQAAWRAANTAATETAEKDRREIEPVEPLNPISMHECRHTFASLMIAAAVNAKALCDYMGHASIQTTFDRYGHLMPGNEAEAAGLLDAYLDAALG